ncbi:MAG: hypothetical protein JKX86_08140 [Verrucomicrobiales bacterium]|nr:hypothetical protein [Verrucomicrobiales bacterium]
MTLFTVHEWRGGNDTRCTFLNLDHIVAVSDDLVPAKYPEETKTFLLLSTGARLVTLEPFSHLMIRLRLASLQHDGQDACQLTAQGPDFPIDRARED